MRGAYDIASAKSKRERQFDALVDQMEIHFRSEDYDAARACARKVMHDRPGSPEARRAQVVLQQIEQKSAEKAGNPASGESPPSSPEG